MSKITITCPDCGKKIIVDILTIDTLKGEINNLKAKIFKLEQESKNPSFEDLFRGFTK